ncbi:hypothetical protein NRF20_20925 [Streptomyces sp. R-74717]|uniref:hypothetical protein n=1 Tax=Streptomyces sp. R-74717 TaxID=2969820 RepID=UPI0039B6CFC7
MKKAATTTALAAIFAAAGCANSAETTDPKPRTSAAELGPGADGRDSTTRSIGETVTLTDQDGHPMQVTGTGIAYRDAYAKDKTLPLKGKYALAIAFTMKSKTGGMLGSQMDNVIKWEGASATAEGRGHADAPWQGCVDTYTPYGTVEPNQEYKAITDVNVPAKGGTLIFDDAYGGEARWELPTEDTGTGTEPATKFATRACW